MTRWNRSNIYQIFIIDPKYWFKLEEFKTSLDKMSNGDLGLVDTVGAMQLAIQAAISEVLSVVRHNCFSSC